MSEVGVRGEATEPASIEPKVAIDTDLVNPYNGSTRLSDQESSETTGSKWRHWWASIKRSKGTARTVFGRFFWRDME